MHLVDDEHLFFEHRGNVYCVVADIAYILNAVVGCGVKLYNVGCSSVVNIRAGAASAAGASAFGIFAVHRLCKDLCRGGLTRTA